jgi:hypothetical protein
VEQQMEARSERAARPAPSASELARQAHVAHLQLTRRGVLDQLSRATHPRHREQLELALAHVDSQLAEAESGR